MRAVFIFLVAAIASWVDPAAAAETRIALVVGNSSYDAVGEIPSPRRDAAAIAEALRLAGFGDVQLVIDAPRATLVQALNAFAAKAAGADWAVIYFAGLGMEFDLVNYLIPVDARLAHDRDAKVEAVSLDDVVASVGDARKLKLVLVDACGKNPFLATMLRSRATRDIRYGLARIEPPDGTLVVFAAKDGNLAVDGEGTAGSPFAAALVNRLATPGLELKRLLRLVRDDVLTATARRQEPFVYGSSPREELFFRPQ